MNTLSRFAICAISAFLSVNILVSCAAKKQYHGASTFVTERANADLQNQPNQGDVEDQLPPNCQQAGAWSAQPIAGFCVLSAEAVKHSVQNLRFLNEKLRLIERKFPHLMRTVRAVGFREIVVSPSEKSESGGAVLGEVLLNTKQISLSQDFFAIDARQSELGALGFSLTEITLMHEFLHAFDSGDDLSRDHLKLLGWDLTGNAAPTGFKFSDAPEILNIWVQDEAVLALKAKLGPKIQTDGPWKVYLEARNEVKKAGYPSIYAVTGGPHESFAELGAYIAFDPQAATYIAAPTVEWFKKEILR